MKTAILKSALCVAIVFASALNINLMAQDKFITNDVMTGEQVTSKIIYRHDGVLYRHMKHDFTYNEQGKITEKESFKWDSRKEEWMPYCKISFTYTSDQVVMNYAKWNEKEKAYNEVQEKNIYELDGFNVPIAYQSYKWNKSFNEWKITNNVKFISTDVLLADMK